MANLYATDPFVGRSNVSTKKMNVDISGARFDELIDMDYCSIWLSMPHQMPASFKIDFRYLVLHSTTMRQDCLSHLSFVFDYRKENVVIPSIATIDFDEPSVMDFNVALYRDGYATFITGNDGQPLRFDHHLECIQRSEPGYKYDVGGILGWPRGDANLLICCHGRVNLSFDPRRCIPASQFDATALDVDWTKDEV